MTTRLLICDNKQPLTRTSRHYTIDYNAYLITIVKTWNIVTEF